MNSQRTLLLLGLAALAVVAWDRHDAKAGYAYSSFGCGGVQCWGTLKSFRSSQEATDWAEFQHLVTDSGETYRFSASYGRQSFSCEAAAYLRPLWNEAMSGDHIFMISWNQQGICYVVDLKNSSSGM